MRVAAPMFRARVAVLLALAAAACSSRARAPDVRAAVAANFAPAFKEAARLFEERTGLVVEGTLGSTGSLATHIEHGALFDVFLSADDEHTRLLCERGHADPESRFVYALGRLAVVGRAVRTGRPLRDTLADPAVHTIAVARPELAPYGRAALEVLEQLDLLDALRTRLVFGSNVGMAWHMAATGGVDLAFVALAHARAGDRPHLEVDPRLHAPIRQEAVLLERARSSTAARRFLTFLRDDPSVAEILRRLGYGAPRGG